MKRAKYFIFSLICLFSCGIVFAKNEIVIKSITPVYDENSGVILSEENGVHSVIFNDKDQSVKYNVVIKNTTSKDIPIEDFELPKTPVDFLKYELTGLNSGDVLKADSTKEVVISLETVKTEGWGRNFAVELTTNIDIDSSVINPNTSTKDLIVILILAAFITGSIIVICKKNKVARYVVLIITLSSTLTIAQAQEKIILSIPLNVSFESQNVMQKAYTTEFICEEDDMGGDVCYNRNEYKSFWIYSDLIKNIYIQNEITEIENYAYQFDVTEKQNGRIMAYLVADEENIRYYDLYIQADGIIYPNPDASYYFADMSKLDLIENIEGLDTSNVTDMNCMFCSTGYDSTIFTLDLSNFDTSNVKSMVGMFESAGYHNQNFTLDISNFDTSNVTNMSRMFYETGYESRALYLDVSHFDTSKVTNMSYMFARAGINAASIPLDLSSFDTSQVTDMSYMFMDMFKDAGTNLKYTLDLSSFDTSNVTNMSGMFEGVAESGSSFILDLSNFDTSKVTDMSSMFSGIGSDISYISLDLSSFDTSQVTDMSAMFERAGFSASNFNLDISHFDTSNVTNMSRMFSFAGHQCRKFNVEFTIENVLDENGYYDMFEFAVTKPGSWIKVNYTTANSSYIDDYIGTKSSNSSVRKGQLIEKS